MASKRATGSKFAKGPHVAAAAGADAKPPAGQPRVRAALSHQDSNGFTSNGQPTPRAKGGAGNNAMQLFTLVV